MNTRGHLQKVFEGILSSQSFELLNNFSQAESWQALLPEEKEVLAQLFLLRAEASAKVPSIEGSFHEARESFRAACRLAPLTARVWYRLGAFLALQESEDDLLEARDALSRAIGLDAGFFDAQYSLASVLLRLGALKGEPTLLRQAEEAFSRTALLFEHEGESVVPYEFYWHWGLAWFLLSRHSGEPDDLSKAIGCYATAKKGIERPEFLNDYANALVELSLLLGDTQYVQAAIPLYRSAIEATIESPSKEMAIHQFNLGCCYHHLFDASSDSSYFEEAERAFSQALAVAPELHQVWPRWGLLLFRAARCFEDVELAEAALEKFRIAEQREPQHPLLLATCSQIFSWIGVVQDDLSLLRRAEAYAQKASVASAQNGNALPDVAAAIALCQSSYGKYFCDIQYLENASKTLQQALVDHPKSAILWYALAQTRSICGRLTDSPQTLREALVCFVLAARSQLVNLPALWHRWGLTFLDVAEITGDEACALEGAEKLERSVQMLKDRQTSWSCDLAHAYELLGDLSDNGQWYERSIAILSDVITKNTEIAAIAQKASCHLRLGELLSDPDEIETSLPLFEKALSQDPEDGLVWAEFGLAQVHKAMHGRSSQDIPPELFQGEESLLHAIALGETHAIYHLACVYALMGNFPEAMQRLHQALELRALPPFRDVRDDEWLEPLSKTAQFQKFLADLEAVDDQ